MPRPWLAPLKKAGKFSSVAKNPNVKTHFLPDRDREIHEREEREKLKVEFIKTQKVRLGRYRSKLLVLKQETRVCKPPSIPKLSYMEISD